MENKGGTVAPYERKWHHMKKCGTLTRKIPLNLKEKWHPITKSGTLTLKSPLKFNQKWHLRQGGTQIFPNLKPEQTKKQ